MVTSPEIPTPPFEIVKPKLLVVEGRDEENFFSSLIAHLGITDIQVRAVGGKYRMASQLSAIANMSSFPQVVSLGVIRDADSDSDGAFASLCGALKAANLPVPVTLMTRIAGPPMVTAMVLPLAAKEGALEDVCLEAIADYPAMSCVNEYIRCLEEHLSSFKPTAAELAKAKVHVFLASKEHPDLRLGEAVQAGFWPWESPAFDTVKQFLNLL